MMVFVSRAEMDSIRKMAKLKSKIKADKREEKRASLPWGSKAKKKPTTLRQVSSRGAIKVQIVHEYGLLDRKLFGPYCRLGVECPKFKRIGFHAGQVAYHLIPQMRGDAARFLQINIVWACSDANQGERLNRSLYREKHIKVFGLDRILKIEEVARGMADFSDADLVEKLQEVRALLGSQK